MSLCSEVPALLVTKGVVSIRLATGYHNPTFENSARHLPGIDEFSLGSLANVGKLTLNVGYKRPVQHVVRDGDGDALGDTGEAIADNLACVDASSDDERLEREIPSAGRSKVVKGSN